MILAEGGAVAGVDMRGSATGSQELDVLSPLHIAPNIHGICLAGGSAFGLEAASGVRSYLESKRIGFAFGGADRSNRALRDFVRPRHWTVRYPADQRNGLGRRGRCEQ